jgi:hypothetical protein
VALRYQARCDDCGWRGQRWEQGRAAWDDKSAHECTPPPLPHDVDRLEAAVHLLETVLVIKTAVERGKNTVAAEQRAADQLYVLRHLPRARD